MLQDIFNHVRLVNKTDDAHFALTFGANKRVCLNEKPNRLQPSSPRRCREGANRVHGVTHYGLCQPNQLRPQFSLLAEWFGLELARIVVDECVFSR
jgi:hypothetical protein